METLILKNKTHWGQKSFTVSTLLAILFFFASLVINYAANIYIIRISKNSVTDIILSNTHVFDVDGIVIYGPLLLIAVVFIIFLLKPNTVPFTLKSISMLILLRAIFMSVTHIGQFTPRVLIDNGAFLNFIGNFNQGGLFFSGHTAFPFILGLIFWDMPILRYLFIGVSIIFGSSMLLGHLHYSIDVLGAFFIAHSMFHITKKLFKEDYDLFITNQG